MSAVSEIMSRGVITANVESNPSVLDIANMMIKSKVGSVVLLKAGKPAGIITERDVIKKVSSLNKKPRDIQAADIMSSPLITVKAYDSVDTAAALMSKNKIKRLPVLETDGSIAGMLSVTDIAKRLAKILVDDYNRYRTLKAALDL
jgi:CBS domain-containing protein